MIHSKECDGDLREFFMQDVRMRICSKCGQFTYPDGKPVVVYLATTGYHLWLLALGVLVFILGYLVSLLVNGGVT